MDIFVLFLFHGESISAFHHNVSCEYFMHILYQVEEFPNIPNLLRVFIMNRCWFRLSCYNSFLYLDGFNLLIFLVEGFCIYVRENYCSPIILFVRSEGFQHFPWNSIMFFHSLSHGENTWHFFFSIPCFGCIILVYGTDGFQIIELALEKCL